MKYTLLFMAVAVSISGCSDSRSFQERKNRLMFDCQCDQGTYEYSYRLGGLLIEEQKATKEYLEKNKNKLFECPGMTEAQYASALKTIDDGIEHNKKVRPNYLTKVFNGDSQIRDINSWRESKYELLVQSLEKDCAQMKSQGGSVTSDESGTAQDLRSVQSKAVQSVPEQRTESEAATRQSAGSALIGDVIDEIPDAIPNTDEDAANKLAKKEWQDENGYIHYPDGSRSSGPVD